MFLEVGKSYVNRGNKVVTIVEWVECSKGYHYKGSDGITYYYDGSTDRDFMTKDALVKEVSVSL